jgi:hypothetical protein
MRHLPIRLPNVAPVKRSSLIPAILSLALIVIPSCHGSVRGNFDLEATFIEFFPNPLTPGSGIGYKMQVRNNGPDPVPAGIWGSVLYVDGVRIFFDYATPSLRKGESITYSREPTIKGINWQPTRSGKYEYKFVVDSNDRLEETNEKNNTVTGIIEVIPN